MNLALFEVYAGGFDAAEKQINVMPEPHPYAVQALALSQLGRGMVREAAETYERLKSMDRETFAAAGLGDLAIYEGRFSDAIRMLEEGARPTSRPRHPTLLRIKLTSARMRICRRTKQLAVAAAEKALQNSNTVMPVQFLAGRVLD